MSMNRYMHPRNIYKEPPNFKKLAIEYPEFRKYITTDLTGKTTFDFKNTEALRCLTRTLLKKDFNLEVTVPLNKLIPTIPLRLNYILWLEDLITLFDVTQPARGIDIGTGASCIYPLLAAVKNQWSMVATEIDLDSLNCARKNVTDNSLDKLITVCQASEDNLLLDLDKSQRYDFCMCNPPFFSSVQELHPFFKDRKQNRPHPKNAFCSSVNEIVVKGGEVEYISKLISESILLGDRIKLYTTMLGHKTSLVPLKKMLREAQVMSFKQTEFCQGNTTRWGLAWTYHDVDLRRVKDPYLMAKRKEPKPLMYLVPKAEGQPYKVSSTIDRLIKIFKELEIDYQVITKVKGFCEIMITAYSNTWSHQRRKKREMKRHNNSDDSVNSSNDINTEENEVHSACDKLAELDVNNGRNKRALDEDDGYYNRKKLRVDLDQSNVAYLRAKICVMRVKTDIGVEMIFIEGTGNKDSLNQVLQYVKNKIDSDH